jgi:hypothetical protein
VITVSVQNDLARIQRQLNDFEKRHLPYATARALTHTAQEVRKSLQDEMSRVFDRPTAYTLNSLYVRPATRSRLMAMVWLKGTSFKGTPADKFLGPQIFGGQRSLKRFEKSLKSAGLLPEGMYAVPGDAAKLDANGNMDRGQIVQILSFLRAFGETGYRANMSDKRRKGFSKRTGVHYFVGKPGSRLPLGVWERREFAFGSSVRPILIFIKAPKYKKLFKFFEVGRNTAENKFPVNLRLSLAQALATSR